VNEVYSLFIGAETAPPKETKMHTEVVVATPIVATVTETVAERVARLSLTDISEKRMGRLEVAHASSVSDETFTRLANASRVGSTDGIILPGGRYHHCSRAKGWARLGRGDSAQWGESRPGGWRVTLTGQWTVQSSDGFSRNEKDSFLVEKIKVGHEEWFIVE
jgi:hypothetical protein